MGNNTFLNKTTILFAYGILLILFLWLLPTRIQAITLRTCQNNADCPAYTEPTLPNSCCSNISNHLCNRVNTYYSECLPPDEDGIRYCKYISEVTPKDHGPCACGCSNGSCLTCPTPTPTPTPTCTPIACNAPEPECPYTKTTEGWQYVCDGSSGSWKECTKHIDECPRDCEFSHTTTGACCGDGLREATDVYTWSDGSGTCNEVLACSQPDFSCNTPPSDTPPPTCSVSVSPNGNSATGTVNMIPGLNRVDWKVDNNSLGTNNGTSATANNLSCGNHNFYATEWDSNNQNPAKTCSYKTFNIGGSSCTNPPPPPTPECGCGDTNQPCCSGGADSQACFGDSSRCRTGLTCQNGTCKDSDDGAPLPAGKLPNCEWGYVSGNAVIRPGDTAREEYKDNYMSCKISLNICGDQVTYTPVVTNPVTLVWDRGNTGRSCAGDDVDHFYIYMARDDGNKSHCIDTSAPTWPTCGPSSDLGKGCGASEQCKTYGENLYCNDNDGATQGICTDVNSGNTTPPQENVPNSSSDYCLIYEADQSLQKNFNGVAGHTYYWVPVQDNKGWSASYSTDEVRAFTISPGPAVPFKPPSFAYGPGCRKSTDDSCEQEPVGRARVISPELYPKTLKLNSSETKTINNKCNKGGDVLVSLQNEGPGSNPNSIIYESLNTNIISEPQDPPCDIGDKNCNPYSSSTIGISGGSTYLHAEARVGGTTCAVCNMPVTVLQPAPGSFTLNTPISGCTGSGYISLSWSKSDNASSYQIWRIINSVGSSWLMIGTTTTLNYIDSSVAKNGTTSYIYTIKAVNSTGTKDSNSKTTTAPSCADPYIQTTGGDVHSNIKINAPGGL